MHSARIQLHKLIDQLPDQALEHAKVALEYCNDPQQQRITIEKAKQRARANSERHLRKAAETTGTGFLSSVGSDIGGTSADGNYRCSMAAFEDGKEATYHLYVFRGHMFEVVETIEISADSEHLVRRERITGVDGKERLLIAELPASSRR